MTLERRTVYFDDLVVGEETRTVGRTIAEADLVAFSGLSGDYSRLHTDAPYAADGPYGRRVAHGLLILSIASGLVARLGYLDDSILGLREVACKFSRPVFAGDTVHATARVRALRPMRRLGGGLVDLEVRLHNQRGEVVLSSTLKLLVRNAPGDAGA